MRVWDCDPLELSRPHLTGEFMELHTMFSATVARKADMADVGYVNHPEVVRFASRLDGLGLLVARFDFVREEGERRGYAFRAPLDARRYSNPAKTDSTERLWVAEEYDGWYEFAVHVNWPLLVHDRPATPWEREGLTYRQYRLDSQYADGVVEAVPERPSPDTPGWQPDQEFDSAE